MLKLTFVNISNLSQETLQNLMNSTENLCEFHADSVKLQCSYITAELQHNFCGVCLPFPRNNFSLSADLSLPSKRLRPSPWNVSAVYKYDTQASYWWLRMYVHTLCTMQYKPSSAGNSKTIVRTYATVICCTTVVKIEASTCSLPLLLGRR